MQLGLCYLTGVELCQIRSRSRIHLSAITCPLEEEEEEANSGLASDRVVGIRIADRESREHGSTIHRALLQPDRLLITVFAFFTPRMQPRMEMGELAAVRTSSMADNERRGGRMTGCDEMAKTAIVTLSSLPPSLSQPRAVSLSLFLFFALRLFLSSKFLSLSVHDLLSR